MKTPDDVVKAVTTRLNDTWHLSVLAELGIHPPTAATDQQPDPTITGMETGAGQVAAEPAVGGPVAPPWPRNVALGRPTSAQVAADFGSYVQALQQWREWSLAHGVVCEEEARSIAGTSQQLPVRIVVPDVDTAAALVGDGWTERLLVARTRADMLADEFPHLRTHPHLGRTLRAVVGLSELDFTILRQVAAWFAAHPSDVARGLTPRQVPLPGVHAKWLNKHQDQVATLANLNRPATPGAAAIPSSVGGRGALGLLAPHPARVHFTYLDPTYLASGRRRHDSYSVGDAAHLPYAPQVVVISENKDTAVGFPPVPGGVAIEGAGAGGGTIAAVGWVRAAPLVVYWGDMDAEGLVILNEFRATGLDVISMLMDVATYRTYQVYGTNHAPNGQPLKVAKRVALPHLRDEERELYELLLSGQAPFLRVEQERIQLSVALDALTALKTGPGAASTD